MRQYRCCFIRKERRIFYSLALGANQRLDILCANACQRITCAGMIVQETFKCRAALRSAAFLLTIVERCTYEVPGNRTILKLRDMAREEPLAYPLLQAHMREFRQ